MRDLFDSLGQPLSAQERRRAAADDADAAVRRCPDSAIRQEQLTDGIAYYITPGDAWPEVVLWYKQSAGELLPPSWGYWDRAAYLTEAQTAPAVDVASIAGGSSRLQTVRATLADYIRQVILADEATQACS